MARRRRHAVRSRRYRRKSSATGASVLCGLLGTAMLLIVILFCIPLTVPRMFGYEIYNVMSGSMEPEIPVGSMVFIQKISPTEIKKMDVIAYHSGDSVVIHRAIENYPVEGLISTKGDANDQEDMHQVPYGNVIGRMVKHYPRVGQLMLIYTSRMGKILLLCFAASGALFNLLASRLRKEAAEKRELRERYEEEEEAETDDPEETEDEPDDELLYGHD